MGKNGCLITMRSLFLQGLWHLEKVAKVGMMCGCQNHPDVADWRTHILSLVFDRSCECKGYLVTPKRASLHSSGGGKNGLRRVRNGTSHLVRSAAATSAGFALCRPPDLPRFGGAAGGLSQVRRSEARAA